MLPGLTMVEDLGWVEAASRWGMCLEVTLRPEEAKELPERTRWWVAIDDGYPRGDIDVFPSVEAGTDKTFHHQHRNDPPEDAAVPWRRGKVCFWSPNNTFGRTAFVTEPIGRADRLAWVFRQLEEWVHRAATGTLVSPTDPFELPDFRSETPTLAFSESPASFAAWCKTQAQSGIVALSRLGTEGPYVVREFQSLSRSCIAGVEWGTEISGKPCEFEAAWIRLPEVPILPPYRAPSTWGELRRAAGHGLDALLSEALGRLRDGARHLCLVGFPIPRTFEPAASLALMHWQVIELPPLANGRNYRNGFRANPQGYWMQDRYREFRDEARIKWLTSCNWHEDQLAARGRMTPAIADASVGIIGVGAVGSVLAEMLVRGGVKRLLVLDPDDLEAGNLVRHTLGLSSVGNSKAAAMAQELNNASPHARVTGVPAGFPTAVPATTADQLRGCKIVFDCTARDSVLRDLGTWGWPGNTSLISLSLGFEANRLYMIAGRSGLDFLGETRNAFAPEFARDRALLEKANLPAEALGCWHPLFPARVDRIWAMVATALSHVEQWLVCEKPDRARVLLTWHEGQITAEPR